MTLDHRQNHLESIRAALSVLLYPIQYIVNFPVSAGNWLGENMVSRETLLEQNATLTSQNAFLKAQMQKYIALEVENMRLRRLLDASEQLKERVLAAELLAVDLDPFSHKVVINKGTVHDIYEGQPLLDADGVYGQVIHSSPLTSQIMLITDPSHALPVQVNRNGLRTIATGTGNMEDLELLHIPNNADIKVGDVLVTSGLGGVFPVGYPVAEVTAVTPDISQPYAMVNARPLAKLDRSREVLLVWSERRLSSEAVVEQMKQEATP